MCHSTERHVAIVVETANCRNYVVLKGVSTVAFAAAATSFAAVAVVAVRKQQNEVECESGTVALAAVRE